MCVLLTVESNRASSTHVRRFATHPLYRYESGDYAVAQPGMNEFVAFNLIIKRFVADGSPEEINIRCAALQLTVRCVWVLVLRAVSPGVANRRHEGTDLKLRVIVS